MKYAPLKFDDENFAINERMRLAPKMLHRELPQNAFEAALAPNETVRLVRFYAEDGKLGIINSGVGMDEDVLRKSTNFNFSTKTMGFEGSNNRGVGGKICSGKYNEEGIVYRSSTDGIDIYQAEIFYNKTDRVWARRVCEVDQPDDTVKCEETYPVDLDDTDPETREVSDRQLARYAEFGALGSFTEVILKGNRPDHLTAFNPYDEAANKIVKQRFANYMFSRWYSCPVVRDEVGKDHPEIPVIVEFEADFTDTGSSAQLIFTDQLVKDYPDHFDHLDDRFSGMLPGGVIIEYLCTKNKNDSTPYATLSMGYDSGRAGLVWNKEIYGSQEANKWKRESTSYGLYSMSKEVSVFVHLPDNYCYPDAYRENVRSKISDEQINLDYFRDAIYNNRPNWLKEKMQDREPKQGKNERVAKELRTLYSKLQSQYKKSKEKEAVFEVAMGGTFGGGGGGNTNTGTGGTHQSSHDSLTGGVGPSTNPKTRKRLVPHPKGDKTGRGNKVIPDIKWLTTDEHLTEFPQIDNRGAFFMEHPMFTLFLNWQYPKVDEFLNQFLNRFDHTTREALRPMAIKELQDHIAIKIGSALIEARFLRGKNGWTDDEVEHMLSPMSLSSVFNVSVSDNDIGNLVIRIKKSDAGNALLTGGILQATIAATAQQDNEAIAA